MIRVGRCTYENGKRVDPTYDGFKNIIVMTKSSAYGSLSPYELRDSRGRNMENLWQYAKVYTDVPKSTQRYSRYDRTVIWDWPAEKHVDIVDGNHVLRPEYFKWREAGMNAKYAIRYPVGYNHRHKCLYALKNNQDGTVDPTPLNYIDSRKQIYLPLYVDLVIQQPDFTKLLNMVKSGINLLIIEVDGPHQESLPYYQEKYGVSDDFIEGGTMLATKENLNIMLNDPKHPFGHGYCLSLALLINME